MINKIKLAAFTAVATLGLYSASSAADTIVTTYITINIVDENPALGFSDPTAAAPVGGNPGMTVGEQRREAYKKSAEIWGAILQPEVHITVQATFAPLTCTATGAVLGAAGTLTVWSDFGGESFPNTWYSAALANHLTGEDLGGSDPDPALEAPPFADEIISFFNSTLGQPDSGLCSTIAWYYGFDHNGPPGSIDFLNVLTHELGHGLGFQSFASRLSGAAFLGLPDQWSRFQRDNLLAGKHWDQMIDIERQFSTANGPHLVWTGPNLTSAAPSVLGPAKVIFVNEPAANQGTELPFGTASFGPAVPDAGITDDVAATSPADGCGAITNDVSGKIALINRGTCTFTSKAVNAEDAGAIAVIIANNVPDPTPPGLGGTDPTVTIPTVSVTQAGGVLLGTAGTNVTIGAPNAAGLLAGADPAGLVKLYAPAAVAVGSSVSHFDVSASPNLLMEPFINADLGVNDPAKGVDLTDEFLADIGWNGEVSCPVDSNDGATVVIGGCNSGVPNRQGRYALTPSKSWLPGKSGFIAGGCFLADVIDSCQPLLNVSKGQYQSCIVNATSDLTQQGLISKDEASRMNVCAASL